MMQLWTPERDAELVRLRDAGKTYEEIGDLLGCGKNGAISRARRKNLVEAVRIPAPSARPYLGNLPSPGSCLYAFGTVLPYRFCGAAVESGSWCPEHRALVYVKSGKSGEQP